MSKRIPKEWYTIIQESDSFLPIKQHTSVHGFWNGISLRPDINCKWDRSMFVLTEASGVIDGCPIGAECTGCIDSYVGALKTELQALVDLYRANPDDATFDEMNGKDITVSPQKVDTSDTKEDDSDVKEYLKDVDVLLDSVQSLIGPGSYLSDKKQEELKQAVDDVLSNDIHYRWKISLSKKEASAPTWQMWSEAKGGWKIWDGIYPSAVLWDEVLASDRNSSVTVQPTTSGAAS